MKKFLFALLLLPNLLFSQDIESLYSIADSLIMIDSNAAALKIYQKILKLNPEDSSRIYTSLGKVYINLGDADSSEYFLNQAFNVNTSNAETYAQMSRLLFSEEEIDSALMFIESARVLKDSAYYDALEAGYLMANDSLSRAYELLNAALSKEPENNLALYFLAFLYAKVNMLDSALITIDFALEQKQDAKSYSLKAKILSGLERYSDAIAEINKALEKKPDNADYVTIKADILLELEQYQEMLDLVKPLLKKSPELYYYAALGFYNLEEVDSALAYIDEAKKIDKKNSLYYYMACLIYYDEQKYNEAYIEILAAIDLEPTNVEYYAWAASCKIMLNTDKNVYSLDDKFAELNQSNMKKMTKMVKSPTSKYYFPKLKSKFQTDMSTLGYDEFFMLYYGYSQQPNFSGYSNTNPQIVNAYNNEDFETCIKLAFSQLERYPTSLSSYLYIANSYFYLGDYVNALKYIIPYHGFMKSIWATGDGMSKESAIIITSVADEYSLLNYLGYSSGRQELLTEKKHSYDVIYFSDGDYNGKIYFNIDTFFRKKF
jgi:tetratricopeptide (TPR) repeat protein